MIYTIARRLFYGDAADCIVAMQIYDKEKDSPAFKLKVAASLQALVRARKVIANARLVVETGAASYEAKLKAREDYETQVEKALKDYGSSIKESDRQQLKLILRQHKNELQEARAWIKNSMTIVANCNRSGCKVCCT